MVGDNFFFFFFWLNMNGMKRQIMVTWKSACFGGKNDSGGCEVITARSVLTFPHQHQNMTKCQSLWRWWWWIYIEKEKPTD